MTGATIMKGTIVSSSMSPLHVEQDYQYSAQVDLDY